MSLYLLTEVAWKQLMSLGLSSATKIIYPLIAAVGLGCLFQVSGNSAVKQHCGF